MNSTHDTTLNNDFKLNKMDIVLIIMICFISLLLLYVNIYLLALYCHPEDGGFGSSFVCKIIVVLGLTVSWANLLLLPVDISDTRGGQNLNMKLGWQIMFYSVLSLTTVLIPIANFYYESDEDKPFVQRLCMTCFQEFIVALFVGLSIFLTYANLCEVQIPVQVLIQNTTTLIDSRSQYLNLYMQRIIIYPQEEQKVTLNFNADFGTFIGGLMVLVGYFLLILFGGIGMTALPLDLIKEFRMRPARRTTQEATEKKKQLKQQSEELIKILLRLKGNNDEKETHLNHGWFSKNKQKGKIDRALANVEKRILALQEEHEIFKLELQLEQANPLVYCMKLFMGVIFLTVTILWWVHILLFVILKRNGFPLNPFLNKMFLDLEAYNVNFIGVFFFGLFTLYLLWCVTKGNLKCGIQIPYILKMHPMKINATWMNSFLFNIALILYASVAVLHFSISCFSQYTRFTAASMIFRVQLQNSQLLSWAFQNNVFELGLFGWSLLAGLVQIALSFRKPGIIRELEKRKKAQKDGKKKMDQVEIELKEYLITK